MHIFIYCRYCLAVLFFMDMNPLRLCQPSYSQRQGRSVRTVHEIYEKVSAYLSLEKWSLIAADVFILRVLYRQQQLFPHGARRSCTWWQSKRTTISQMTNSHWKDRISFELSPCTFIYRYISSMISRFPRRPRLGHFLAISRRTDVAASEGRFLMTATAIDRD